MYVFHDDQYTSNSPCCICGLVCGGSTWQIPGSKVHGANMGPYMVLPAPDGPHVGLMNLAIWDRPLQHTVDSNAKPWCFLWLFKLDKLPLIKIPPVQMSGTFLIGLSTNCFMTCDHLTISFVYFILNTIYMICNSSFMITIFHMYLFQVDESAKLSLKPNALYTNKWLW